jgi:hypothetical protein
MGLISSIPRLQFGVASFREIFRPYTETGLLPTLTKQECNAIREASEECVGISASSMWEMDARLSAISREHLAKLRELRASDGKFFYMFTLYVSSVYGLLLTGTDEIFMGLTYVLMASDQKGEFLFQPVMNDANGQ